MAAILAAVSLIAPVSLKPINILWFQFGLLLHRVVNPVVMFAMFALVFVPAGMIMRIWRDPLRLRRRTTGASTYWIERKESGDTEESMTNPILSPPGGIRGGWLNYGGSVRGVAPMIALAREFFAYIGAPKS